MDGLSNPPVARLDREIAELFAREGAGLLRYARGLGLDGGMAEDARQVAFFRFFLCRAAGQEIESPKAWLFRVVRHYACDQHRADGRNHAGMESLANMPGPALPAETGWRLFELMQALPRIGLSAREMECVRLRSEDMSYEEIAGVLGLKAGTVGALLARAHEKARKAAGERQNKAAGERGNKAAGARHNAAGFGHSVAAEKRYAS